MSISIVATTATLLSALAVAHPGDVIQLATGSYAHVDISSLSLGSRSQGVTITSADAAHPATITDMVVRYSSGLNFSGLEFSTVGAAFGTGGPSQTNQFQILGCSNIGLDNLNVHGDPNGTLATDVNGFFIRSSTNVSLTNSTFSHLHYAVGQLDNSSLTVSSNEFQYIWDDGVRGGGSSNVVIANNTFTSFHMNASDRDHPDAIQFWTFNENRSVSNITITGNTYTRGAGNPIEGIFLRDETGHLPYLNVKIVGNTVEGAGYNAIWLDNARSSLIDQNIVTAYTDFTAWIRVINSNGVTVSNNSSTAYSYTNDLNLTLVGNIVNQPIPNPGSGPDAVGSETESSRIREAIAAALASGYGLQASGPTDYAGVRRPGAGYAPVPEPSAWTLMLAGFGLAATALRRRGPLVST